MAYPINRLFDSESLQELDDAFMLTLHTPNAEKDSLRVRVEGKEMNIYYIKPDDRIRRFENDLYEGSVRGNLVVRSFLLKWEIEQERVKARQNGDNLYIEIKKKRW